MRVPKWQKKELSKRESNLRKNPKSAISWQTAKERIRKKKGK